MGYEHMYDVLYTLHCLETCERYNHRVWVMPMPGKGGYDKVVMGCRYVPLTRLRVSFDIRFESLEIALPKGIQIIRADSLLLCSLLSDSFCRDL
jgi:hypothetical protein